MHIRDDTRWVSMVNSRGESPGPLVIKKDDEPLLNLTGAMSRCSREKVLMCTQKRGTRVPSLNTGALVCTR